MATNTILLHRVFRSTAEKLYRAFLDAQVGGSYHMSFTNFTTGDSHAFGGEYLELEPGKRIRYTDRFDDPNLPGTMQTTVTFAKVFCGTELNVVQEGIPAMIPVQACYLGWQESLALLAQLVGGQVAALIIGPTMVFSSSGSPTVMRRARSANFCAKSA